jgi:hypothetical protein
MTEADFVHHMLLKDWLIAMIYRAVDEGHNFFAVSGFLKLSQMHTQSYRAAAEIEKPGIWNA